MTTPSEFPNRRPTTQLSLISTNRIKLPTLMGSAGGCFLRGTFFCCKKKYSAHLQIAPSTYIIGKAFPATTNRRAASYFKPTPNAPQWSTRQYARPTQPRTSLGPEIFLGYTPSGLANWNPASCRSITGVAVLVRGHGDPWFEKQIRHLPLTYLHTPQ